MGRTAPPRTGSRPARPTIPYGAKQQLEELDDVPIKHSKKNNSKSIQKNARPGSSLDVPIKHSKKDNSKSIQKNARPRSSLEKQSHMDLDSILERSEALAAQSKPKNGLGFSPVIALLKTSLDIFSEVPYVKIPAGIALQILEMVDQVYSNKERAAELVGKVATYSEIIFDSLSKIQNDPTLYELKDDLSRITEALIPILKLLESLQTTKGVSTRLMRGINSADIASQIEEQDRRLDTAVNAFQFKTSILRRRETSAKLHSLPQKYTSYIPRSSKTRLLRSKPQITFGRESETDTIVNVILASWPTSRITILGAGGMGKTTLSLAVLHDNRIIQKYHDSRMFVSCEAASTVDLILHELSLALGISSNLVTDDVYGRVVQALAQYSPCLLVLDNFDTPWDSDPEQQRDVESFLQDLTSLEGVSVLLTMRGSQRPNGVQWSTLTPQILHPVTADAAAAIFSTISGNGEEDKSMRELVAAVDCVPLAVTLLANLAACGESTQSLLSRLKVEKTSMIELGGKGDRLTNLDSSIRMSLSSPRMTCDNDALLLLSLLCLLPDGLSGDALVNFERVSKLNVKKSIATLNRNALVYFGHGRADTITVRVLAPIRMYIYNHHPPSRAQKKLLQTYYLDLITNQPQEEEQLLFEAGNIEAVLVDLLRSAIDSESVSHATQATLNFARYCYYSGKGPTSSIALATELLEKQQQAMNNTVVQSSFTRKKVSKNLVSRSTSFRWLGIRLFKQPQNEQSHDGIQNTTNPSTNLKVYADCLGCFGQMLSRDSNVGFAKQQLTRALEYHTMAGDDAGRAHDLFNLGCLSFRDSSTLAEADSNFYQAKFIHEQIGDNIGIAYDLMGIAHILQRHNQYDTAIKMFTDALDLFTQHTDIFGQGCAENNLGQAYLLCSRFTAASEHFNASLKLLKPISDVLGQVDAYAGLATVLLLQSQFSQAHQCINEALSLGSATANKLAQADCLHILGRILIALSQYSSAETSLLQALEIHTELNEELSMAHDWLNLSQVHLKRADIPPAVEFMEKAHTAYEKLNFIPGAADVLNTKSIYLLQRSALVEADQTIRTAIRIRQTFNGDLADSQLPHQYNLGLAYDLFIHGCILLKLDSIDEAEETLKRALELHINVGNVQGQADDQNKLAHILLRRNLLQDATLLVSRNMRLHQDIDDVSGQADDWYLQALIFLQEQSRLSDAESAVRKALELHTVAGAVYSQATDLYLLRNLLEDGLYEASRSGGNIASRRDEILGHCKAAVALFEKAEAKEEAEQCAEKQRCLEGMV